MKKKTFQWIWSNIELNIQAIEDGFTEEEKERFNFRRVYKKDKAASVIMKEYGRIKDDFKREYYKSLEPKNAQGTLIDHHKIAACLCKALLNKKIFVFDLNDSISVEMLLSNYKLAYAASLTILYINMLEWYANKGDIDLNSLMEQKTILDEPGTSKTHLNYHSGRIKALAQNEHRGLEFDILTYADMMFWIEHYNRQLIEGKVIVEQYDPDVLND